MKDTLKWSAPMSFMGQCWLGSSGDSLHMAALMGSLGLHVSMHRVYFTQQARTNTSNGLSVLSVSSTDFSYLNPVLIATAVIYLVILALLAVVSFARSFVEAAHDATGVGWCPLQGHLWRLHMMQQVWNALKNGGGVWMSTG